MAAMYDLTDITGLKADRARTSTILIWQVPAEWIWPSIWGTLIGLPLSVLLIPLLGPSALAASFLGAPAAVALTVRSETGESRWNRAVSKVQSNDETFMFCGVPLEMHPDTIVHVVPSATRAGSETTER